MGIRRFLVAFLVCSSFRSDNHSLYWETSRSTPSWLLIWSGVIRGKTRKVSGSLLVSYSFSWTFRGKLGKFPYHFSVHLVCVILVAHNFTELVYGRADYGYLAFGELSQFVYWLLQKVKRSSDLPVIEKWDARRSSRDCRSASVIQGGYQ